MPGPSTRQGNLFRWLRRLAVLFGLTALAAVTLVVLYNRQRDQQPKPIWGTLHIEPTVESDTLRTGEFAVQWNADGGGSLEIRPADDRQRLLWATVPGMAFVGAAVAQEAVHEERGSFTIRDDRQQLCRKQTVESIDGGQQVVVAGRLTCDDGESWTYRLTLHSDDPEHVAFDLQVPGAASSHSKGNRPNRLFLTYASQADERFYGLGEQFTHLNLKGRRVPIFTQEQGIGRGAQPITLAVDLVAGSGGSWHSTYTAIPFYLTSRQRAVMLENEAYTAFDLRHGDRVQLELFGNHLRGRILNGTSAADLLRVHTGLSGRMRPLPGWIHDGAVIGMQGGTERVREVLARLEAHDVPVSAFWLQDWVGQRRTSFGKQLWWSWQLDAERYPGWDDLVADLRQRGIRVLTYVNPFLVPVDDEARRPLFEEAEQAGYLVRRADGTPYLIPNTSFSAGMLDLSNPAARRWMLEVLHDEVIGAGASGWMADFGEALPYDAVLHDGDPKRWHNRYPQVWAELNRQAIDATGRGEDFVFFSRAASRRSPADAPLFWLGDQNVTWDRHDGMQSAVHGLLSGGLSGLTLNHSDIGGYTTLEHPLLKMRRSRELLLRWMELNAFSVVFRSHEGNLPDANAQVYSDDDTLDHFSRCAKIYRAWRDLRIELVDEASRLGLPVVRPMWLHFPDATFHGITHQQFMVGDTLLVAPVLDPGVDRVEVVLPDGRWVHVWSGDVHVAGRTRVDTPLGEPAVFYRQGSERGERFALGLRREGLL